MLITKKVSVANPAKNEFATMKSTYADACVSKIVASVQYLSTKHYHVDTYKKCLVRLNHTSLNAWQNVKSVFLVVICAKAYVVNDAPRIVNTQLQKNLNVVMLLTFIVVKLNRRFAQNPASKIYPACTCAKELVDSA